MEHRTERRRRQGGQAVLEYLLMTAMLAVTVAVAVKNSNQTIYRFWSGLARQVASPCYNCTGPDAPDF